jgi:hypothetical protein
MARLQNRVARPVTTQRLIALAKQDSRASCETRLPLIDPLLFSIQSTDWSWKI